MALTINIPDTLRKSVEAASNGRNTVLYTAKGQPCYMFVLRHADMATANAALGISRHPAFIVNSVNKDELFIGQHLGSSLNSEMLSVPGVDPVNSITFDAAVSLARANGNGWHLMSNVEWAAVQLYCYYAGFQPRGNNKYGNSEEASTERGVDTTTGRLAVDSWGSTYAAGTTYSAGTRVLYTVSSVIYVYRSLVSGNVGNAPSTSPNHWELLGPQTNRTRTGSGPASWRHDNTPFGIADLCGNVWEWQTGARVNSGEINLFANNDAALFAADFAAGSASWKAIDGATGALVAPGTAGTVKYASAASGTADYTLYRTSGQSFEGMVNSTGANPVSAAALAVLKAAGMYPIAASGLGGDYFYLNAADERIPLRGGSWSYSAGAGVFALHCSNARSISDTSLGGRPAFVL